MKNKAGLVTFFVILCLLYALVCMSGAGRPLKPVAKVLPILLLMVNSILVQVRTGDRKQLTQTLALFFSALGDYSGGFIMMTAFFAIAQVFYIISFARNFRLKSARQFVCLGILVALVTSLCAAVLPRMVSAGVSTALIAGGCTYLALLTCMSVSAIGQDRPLWILFAAGSLLFVLSDSTIIFTRYVSGFPGRHLVVMGTYYAAQLLLNLLPAEKHA